MICGRGWVHQLGPQVEAQRGEPHLKVVELVVDVKAKILDPCSRAVELVREAHDEERVERVDEEAAEGRAEGVSCGCSRSRRRLPHYPIGPSGLMLDPR